MSGAHLLMLGLTAIGRPPRQASGSCAVLDLRLVTADSMVALAAQPECGPVCLVVVGEPKRLPQGGSYNKDRLFAVPVALQNVGATPLPLPIAMRADSLAPVQPGRQINAAYMSSYGGLTGWDGQERQQPWRFDSPREGKQTLSPGERSDVRVLKILTTPLTPSIRIWLEIDARPRPPRQPYQAPRGWQPGRAVQLDSTMASFIARVFAFDYAAPYLDLATIVTPRRSG